MADTKERLATAQWVFERVLGWIAQAEIKVGIVVTIDIAMLGGLAAAFSEVSTRTCWMYLFSILSASFAVVGFICAAFSVLPRLDGPERSFLYFGRIAGLQRAEYLEGFKQASDEDLLNDWIEQIHRNAEIAKTKHMWVKKAMWWSFLSAIPWVISIALLVEA